MPFLARLVVYSFALAIFFVAIWAFGAQAQPASGGQTPCPTAQPCKVLILNPDELSALTGPNMILDTAQQGRPLDLAGAVQYFRNKIQNAPAGSSATGGQVEEKK